jgi:hypothetical protein
MNLRACTIVALLLSATPAFAVENDFNIWINEFHYDNTGTDSNEFVEVVAPSSFAALSSITLTLYNGAGGASYDTTTLDTFTVGATVGGFTIYSFTYPVNGIQNGSPDGIALTHSTAGILQFLSYEGSFVAVGGPANGATSTDIGVSQGGAGAVGNSLRMTGNGNSYAEFTWNAEAANSKGAINAGQTFTPVTASETPGFVPPTPTTSLTINEVHANPNATLLGDANQSGVRVAAGDEFVEIINSGASAADISGFTLSDGIGVKHVFPTGTIVPAGGSVVVFGDDEVAADNVFNAAFGGAILQEASTGSLGLNDAGDSITITEVNTSTAAAVTYPDAPNVPNANLGQSINRDPDITGATFDQHSALSPSSALFSPGTDVNGAAFAGGDFDHVLPVNPGDSTTIDFSGYNGSGIAKTPAAGQLDSDVFKVTGASDGDSSYGLTLTSGDYARGSSTGGVTTGGLYAFDVGGGNTALGFQSTDGDFTPGTIELRMLNESPNVIDELSLAYDVLVFNDEGRSNSLDFAYSTDGATFIDVAALDFVSPEAADAAPAWADTPMSAVLSGLDIDPGQFLFLRFTTGDVSGGGSRDELAIDNIVLSLAAPQAVPEPGAWALWLLVGGLAVAAAVRRRHKPNS